jgi:hypothetical protein
MLIVIPPYKIIEFFFLPNCRTHFSRLTFSVPLPLCTPASTFFSAPSSEGKKNLTSVTFYSSDPCFALWSFSWNPPQWAAVLTVQKHEAQRAWDSSSGNQEKQLVDFLLCENILHTSTELGWWPWSCTRCFKSNLWFPEWDHDLKTQWNIFFLAIQNMFNQKIQVLIFICVINVKALFLKTVVHLYSPIGDGLGKKFLDQYSYWFVTECKK